ncbi:hypothetical protein [Humidesulfovibrio idahonensis]
MSPSELLPIVGALSGPAFFLIFALAALGAPLLALVCLLAAALRSTAHPEAYARRLLRMALTCAVPSLLVFAAAGALAAYRTEWLADWVRAAPMGPGLFAVAALAFCASLVTMRLSRPSARHGRQNSPLGQAFILTLLAATILWLGLALGISLQDQAQAILRSPMADGIGVAPLMTPDVTALPNLWTALAALVALSAAAAGAISLEYLLLLRDREPFGRDALAHVLRLAARCTLRAALLAGAFLPVLWTHLPAMPALQGGETAAKSLLGICAAACVLLCVFSGIVARSARPWDKPLSIHAAVLVLWGGLTSLLSVALLCHYAV